MTMQEIKSKLSILTVLSHYHLEVDRNNMMRCPFHEDKEASMRVYPQTNTVYCFAGGCEVDNLDVIDFVMKMEKSTKHEAIKKAEKLLGDQSEITRIEPKIKPAPLAVHQSFNRYLKSFSNHKKSQEYCENRALEWNKLEIGYKSQKAKDRWARACIIFPLKNELNEVVSLYGRNIYAPGHYYQAGRNGLYPAYPKQETKTLLLTESIIDAATFLPLDLGCDPDSNRELTILALYGTNGLTTEHKNAIKKLVNLEEIILALDADEAGQMATAEIAKILEELCPKVVISTLVLPEGEDINSLAVSHENTSELFKQLIADRATITAGKEKVQHIKPAINELDTSNPHNIKYSGLAADHQIKGFAPIAIGAKSEQLDSLKISLQIIDQTSGYDHRAKLDLYEYKQIKSVCNAATERLNLRYDLLEKDLCRLTNLLEIYRANKKENKPYQSIKIIVPQATATKCIDFLKRPNLIKNINQLIGKAGIRGEQENRILLFVIASSYKMPDTLHALIQGSSGSGKTRLMKIISDLMPPEDIKRYTRVTDNSFYNQDEYFFVNKLICFEDMDGLKEDAQLAVRELQSNEILRTSTSIKDASGSIRGGERIVRGPIASLSCTTRGETYEDNVSRSFLIAVDESPEQTLRIIDYQNEVAAGLVNKSAQSKIIHFLQNCVRLLQPYEVINPFASKIKLPREAHKIRRLNELYQSFVRQITLLNQYQRKRDKQGRLISEKEDLQTACDILFESILLKVDELDGSLRQFFEQLKSFVEKKGKDYEFNRFEAKTATGMSKAGLHRKIQQLVQLEYIKQFGFANRGYRYKIAYWDNMSALRSKIKADLKRQLDEL